MEQPGELLDKRRTYNFYVDDALIDHFAPKIGVYGIAVYVLLVRHAKNHKAFPSWSRMVERLGISRKTVQRTLTDLENTGLIKIKKRRSAHGDSDTSLYTIQDLSHLRTPSDTTEVVTPGNHVVDVGNHVVDQENQGGDSRKPQVVDVGNHGGGRRELEGISLKESQLKGEENASATVVELSTPCGDSDTARKDDVPPKGKTKKPATPWPADEEDAEAAALSVWLANQQVLTVIIPPLDFDWWCDMSYVLNGLPSLDWLEQKYAKMQMWLKENPRKKPSTPKGVSRFVRGWLERDFDRERRQRTHTPAKEIHIHYAGNNRR